MSGLLLTSRSLLTSGSFLAIAGAIIALVGVVFSVWFYLSPRKANEAPPALKHLPTLRLWRPKEYSLAFAYLNDYCKALKSKRAEPVASERNGLQVQDEKFGARGFVSETDLVRLDGATSADLCCHTGATFPGQGDPISRERHQAVHR